MVKNEIVQKFKSVPNDIEVVCVGTTRAHYAFDFSALNCTGFNMALYRNPLEFNLLLLKKYKRKMKDNALVFISLEYPIFGLRNEKKIAQDNVQQYAKLLPGKNRYCSFVIQMIMYLLPQRPNAQTNTLKYMELLEQKERYMNHFKPWELRRMCDELIDEGWNKEIRISGFVQKGYIDDYETVEPDVIRNRNTVIDIINYCREQGWIPVLVGLPYSKIINDTVSNQFKKMYFYHPIEYVCQETGCDFWDYTDEVSLQDKNLYLEVQYLNKRGRKCFMNLISHRLEEYMERGSEYE